MSTQVSEHIISFDSLAEKIGNHEIRSAFVYPAQRRLSAVNTNGDERYIVDYSEDDPVASILLDNEIPFTVEAPSR